MATDLARRGEQAQLAEQTPRREITLENVIEMTGYSGAEIALVSKTVAQGAPLLELAMFLSSCRKLHLDPITRQAYWIRRKTREQDASGKWVEVMKGAMQIGIDGFRALADGRGDYAGSAEPVFRGTLEIEHKAYNGTVTKILVPEYAQVTCWKIVQGHRAAFTGEARWVEFYPGDQQGAMWRKMPRHMLGKCAEGQALRKGWPAQLGGLELSPDMAEGTGGDVQDLPSSVPQQVVQERPQAQRTPPKVTPQQYGQIFEDDASLDVVDQQTARARGGSSVPPQDDDDGYEPGDDDTATQPTPAPAPPQVQQPRTEMVAGRTVMGQKYATLIEDAARLEVPFDDLKIGFPAEKELLIRTVEKLEARVDAKKRELAGEREEVSSAQVGF